MSDESTLSEVEVQQGNSETEAQENTIIVSGDREIPKNETFIDEVGDSLKNCASTGLLGGFTAGAVCVLGEGVKRLFGKNLTLEQQGRVTRYTNGTSEENIPGVVKTLVGYVDGNAATALDIVDGGLDAKSGDDQHREMIKDLAEAGVPGYVYEVRVINNEEVAVFADGTNYPNQPVTYIEEIGDAPEGIENALDREGGKLSKDEFRTLGEAIAMEQVQNWRNDYIDAKLAKNPDADEGALLLEAQKEYEQHLNTEIDRVKAGDAPVPNVQEANLAVQRQSFPVNTV